MEANIFIEGLEEYTKKLVEIQRKIDELNDLGDELKNVIWNMQPRAEIKMPPNLHEG